MTIKIPDNIVNICNEKTFKGLAMLDNVSTLNTTDTKELENFYKAKLFIEKFKTDCWIFLLSLWDNVWKEQIKEKNISYITPIHNLEQNDSATSIFCISYKIRENIDLNTFTLLKWDEYKIYIGANLCKDDEEYALTDVFLDYSEKKEFTPDDEESYNCSKFGIPLIGKTDISDETIAQLKQAATELIHYYTEHKNKLTQ